MLKSWGLHPYSLGCNSTGTSIWMYFLLYYLCDSLGQLTLRESFFQSYRACAEQLAQWLTSQVRFILLNKPSGVTRAHTASGKTAHGSIYLYLRPCGQNDKVQHSLTTVLRLLSTYGTTYDNFGRLLTKQYHSTSTNKLIYTYNLHKLADGNQRHTLHAEPMLQHGCGCCEKYNSVSAA